jgi:hypothetical protein
VCTQREWVLLVLNLIVHFTSRHVQEQQGELTLAHKKMEAKLSAREAAVDQCVYYTTPYII